jgi:hypothetical protein
MWEGLESSVQRLFARLFAMSVNDRNDISSSTRAVLIKTQDTFILSSLTRFSSGEAARKN